MEEVSLFSHLNLLTYFPVESPARLETASRVKSRVDSNSRGSLLWRARRPERRIGIRPRTSSPTSSTVFTWQGFYPSTEMPKGEPKGYQKGVQKTSAALAISLGACLNRKLGSNWGGEIAEIVSRARSLRGHFLTRWTE